MSVTRFYASPPRSAVAVGSQRHPPKTRLPLLLCVWSAIALASVALCAGQGADTNTPPPAVAQAEEPTAQQLLRVCQQIQEQLQATKVTIEQNRQEARAAAAQNAEALAKGLETLQQALAAQRTRELEALQTSNQAMQRSNKAMLILAGTFAAFGLVALLVMTWFEWRASSKLATIASGWPMARALALGSVGDGRLVPGSSAEHSSLRLLGAIEQLDKRIHEFKGVISPGDNGTLADGTARASGKGTGTADEQAGAPSLFDKAISLMDLDNSEAALTCLNEVLALEPDHTEALVKKGATLERMHRLNEAIECYDRAIALDAGMTVAYLHKGGLCSRLERFKEALECYEKALRTHEQRG